MNVTYKPEKRIKCSVDRNRIKDPLIRSYKFNDKTRQKFVDTKK